MLMLIVEPQRKCGKTTLREKFWFCLTNFDLNAFLRLEDGERTRRLKKLCVSHNKYCECIKWFSCFLLFFLFFLTRQKTVELQNTTEGLDKTESMQPQNCCVTEQTIK